MSMRNRKRWVLFGLLAPIFCLILAFLYFKYLPVVWFTFIVITISIVVFMYIPSRFSQFLALILMLAQSIVVLVYLIIDSCVKGIEFVSGKQEGFFLQVFPKQYGLLSFQNFFLGIILFVLFILSFHVLTNSQRTIDRYMRLKKYNIKQNID